MQLDSTPSNPNVLPDPQALGGTTAGEAFHEDRRRRRPLPADVLNRLTTLNDTRAWVSVFVTVAMLCVTIMVAVWYWSPWLIVPALVLITSRQQACFVLAHDAAHYRLFRRRALNEWVGRALGTIVGVSMCSYRVVHRLHHNDLYGETDPDLPLHGGYPRGKAYLLKKLTRDLLGQTAPKTYAYFFGAPAALRPLDDTSPRLRREARNDRWVVVAFHLIAPCLAFAAGYGVQYLVLWVLPLVTTLQALLRFRAILEHGAVTDLSSPLTAARTNLGPLWLMGLVFPHYVHYHIEHHLYPAIPHYNLPECHAELDRLGLLGDAQVCRVSEAARMVFAPRQGVDHDFG
ncbi:MAG: fatty acid desaturase family protein [Chromatiales bacterium]|nr:fatty acid desaturase family protein [Chromatiales bacterium]